MRLLKRVQSNDSSVPDRFSLINFPPACIPSVYAILSHRWGFEEITFKDLELSTARTKLGYRKLEFCAEQAARDGILYFWIDTCCIDKANNTELSEAINSMFKWYQHATKCYVYLPDVSTKDCGKTAFTKHPWQSAFQASEWFTRGWTLQELLAPRVVEFFSIEGHRLGDKISLEQQLHQITGIPVEALQAPALVQFSMQERFAWAAGRRTTVEEDAAYCLLGIFDIQMALLYGEGEQKALARLRRKIEKSSLSHPFNAARAPWVVPFERNSRFVGREAELAQLEEQLSAQEHTCKWAIVGLGGMGKTQLVLELLHRTKAKHPACTVLWIPAVSRESLLQGYSTVARQLNIVDNDDQDANVESLVRDHLSNTNMRRWILVFDNADDIKLWTDITMLQDQDTSPQLIKGASRLIDYLPQHRQGCILFTTRDRKAATRLAGPNILSLSELSEEATKGLLCKYLGDTVLVNQQQDAATLLAELNYLPLAIVQAATYIIANDITLSEYLQLLREKEDDIIELLSEDFEDHGRYRETKNPVATTWLVSFEQIQKLDQTAAEYLSLMACIQHKGIPRSFLPPASSRLMETRSIGILTAYSFTTKQRTQDTFDLHRLVQLATRNWLRKKGTLVSWQEKATVRLSEVLPGADDYQYKEEWRKYLPHVLYLLGSNAFVGDWKPESDLRQRCTQYLYLDGRWTEAEKLLIRLFEYVDGRHDEDKKPMLLRACLAITYTKQEHSTESDELSAQLIESARAKVIANRTYPLESMNAIALNYLVQGQVSEAEELLVQLVETCKTKPHIDHVDTFKYMGNLVSVYQDRGQLVEAERLQVQLVEAYRTRLSVDHPDTVVSMWSLVKIYRDLKQPAEAEQVWIQLVQIYETKPPNPTILLCMFDLVMIRRYSGRLAEAVKLLTQLTRSCKELADDDQPVALRLMSGIALLWKLEGHDAEAINLLKDCVQRMKRIEHEEYLTNLKLLQKLEAESSQEQASQATGEPEDGEG